MIDDKMIDMLNEYPPVDHLSTRDQSGFTLTYLEGWYVIQVANKIFGAGNWNRKFTGDGVKEVYKDWVEVNKNGELKKRYEVAVTCQYAIEVGNTIAEDIGYGMGQSYNNYGDASESAVKEAVTDALKRCLRSFGNAFGNCLYDKQFLEWNKKGRPVKQSEKAKPKPGPPTSHPATPPAKPKDGNKKETQKNNQPKPKNPDVQYDKADLMDQMVKTFGPVLPPDKDLKRFVTYMLFEYELDLEDYRPLRLVLIDIKTNDAERLVQRFEVAK